MALLRAVHGLRFERGARRRLAVDRHRLRIQRRAIAFDDLAEVVEIAAGHQCTWQRGEYVGDRKLAGVPKARRERRGQPPDLVQPLIPFIRTHRDTHELVGAADVTFGFGQIHEVDQFASSSLDHQRERRLLQHPGVDLPQSEGVEQVGADGGDVYRAWVYSVTVEEIEQEGMVGVAEAGYPDSATRKVADRGDGRRPIGGYTEREQWQPAG